MRITVFSELEASPSFRFAQGVGSRKGMAPGRRRFRGSHQDPFTTFIKSPINNTKDEKYLHHLLKYLIHFMQQLLFKNQQEQENDQ